MIKILNFSQALPEHPVIAELDAFYMKSVVDVNTAFLNFFDVKSAFLQNIGNNLRLSNSHYQASLARFHFDKLTPETRRSFETVTETVDLWLERGLNSAEVGAFSFLWPAYPDGTRSLKTPAEEHMERTLRFSIKQLQDSISVSNDECLAPFVPRMIPSYQPVVDTMIAASKNQIPRVNEESFKNSIASERQSSAGVEKFINTMDSCDASPATEVCIKNFVSFS